MPVWVVENQVDAWSLEATEEWGSPLDREMSTSEECEHDITQSDATSKGYSVKL
jgi:hypothetical protein